MSWSHKIKSVLRQKFGAGATGGSDSLVAQTSTSATAQDLENVDGFISGHLEKVRAYRGSSPARGIERAPTSIFSDVMGTLIGGHHDELVDDFLCDAHALGIPVRLATGYAETSAGDAEILDELNNQVMLKTDMVSSARGIIPGLYIDDDPVGERYVRQGAVINFMRMGDVDLTDFLESWQRLSWDKKQDAMIDWVSLNNALGCNVHIDGAPLRTKDASLQGGPQSMS